MRNAVKPVKQKTSISTLVLSPLLYAWPEPSLGSDRSESFSFLVLSLIFHLYKKIYGSMQHHVLITFCNERHSIAIKRSLKHLNFTICSTEIQALRWSVVRFGWFVNVLQPHFFRSRQHERNREMRKRRRQVSLYGERHWIRSSEMRRRVQSCGGSDIHFTLHRWSVQSMVKRESEQRVRRGVRGAWFYSTVNTWLNWFHCSVSLFNQPMLCFTLYCQLDLILLVLFPLTARGWNNFFFWEG